MTRHEALALPALVREMPVAIVCNGATLGVMMASPDALEDFATGFARTEGLLRAPSDLREVEIVEHDLGIEARVWLSPAAGARIHARQRAMIGPVGCGLCGIDSLAKVARDLPPVPPGPRFDLNDLLALPDLLRAHQPEHDRTRGCHAAGFWRPGEGLVLSREDVGRHNALDKLAGALWRQRLDPTDGIVVLTSRVSTEMVQKAVAMGTGGLVAVSAATDYAVRIARDRGLILVARTRGGAGEVLSGAERLD